MIWRNEVFPKPYASLMLMTKEPLSAWEALKVEKIFSTKMPAEVSRPNLSSEVGWSE